MKHLRVWQLASDRGVVGRQFGVLRSAVPDVLAKVHKIPDQGWGGGEKETAAARTRASHNLTSSTESALSVARACTGGYERVAYCDASRLSFSSLYASFRKPRRSLPGIFVMRQLTSSQNFCRMRDVMTRVRSSRKTFSIITAAYPPKVLPMPTWRQAHGDTTVHARARLPGLAA